MKSLVTGSAGHLGEALVRTLRDQGQDVAGLDIKPTPFTDICAPVTDGAALNPPAAPAAWINEAVEPVPKNIYGTTKTAAESLCHLFHLTHDLPCAVPAAPRSPARMARLLVEARLLSEDMGMNGLIGLIDEPGDIQDR